MAWLLLTLEPVICLLQAATLYLSVSTFRLGSLNKMNKLEMVFTVTINQALSPLCSVNVILWKYRQIKPVFQVWLIHAYTTFWSSAMCTKMCYLRVFWHFEARIYDKLFFKIQLLTNRKNIVPRFQKQPIISV